MTKVFNVIAWLGALFISVIFLDSLRFKFAGHPTPEYIFTTLRDWSGIGLFYPAGPWIIGLAEAFAALCLLFIPAFLMWKHKQATAYKFQMLGALVALGVMSGAIVFHLFTPLGIETPTAWANGEPIAFGPFLFISACVSWLAAAFILAFRGSQRK